jgi:hypothetical protein
MIVALLPLLAAPLAAQDPAPRPLVVHIELSFAHISMPTPDSVDDLAQTVHRPANQGGGFNLAGVFEVRDRWHFVLGIEHSTHATGDSPNDVSVLQLYIEGRYMFQIANRMQPYVYARLGYLHTGNDMELYDDTNTLVPGHAVQTGPAVGVGAGVLVTATKRLQVFAAGGAQFFSLSDIDFDGYHVGDSSLSGVTLSLRAGMSINFGPDGNARKLSRR